MTTLPADLDDKTLHALIEVMYLAAMADEEVTTEERERFAESIGAMTGGRLSGESVSMLTESIGKELQASSLSARMESISQQLRDPTTRTLAFSLAVRVVAADAILRTSERELLFELTEGLELSRDDAADLVKKIAG